MKKMNLAKVVCLFCAFSLLMITGLSTSAIAAEKSYKWKLGEPFTKGTLQYELTEDWIKRVEEATEGRVKIKHYPGSLLGDYTSQAEAVASGAQDLAIIWPTTNVAGPGADVYMLGYVYRNWDEFSKGMLGWMYDLHKDLFKDINWEILGTLPDGFLTIVSTKKFDPMPGPKDVKVRLMPTELLQVRFKELGFSTLSMPYSEFVPALSLGTVDAGGNAAWSEGWYTYKDVIKYIYDARDMTSTTFLIMNKDLFASLSEKDQKAISEVSAEWSKNNFAAIQKENEKYRKQLIEHGIEIISYTDEQWLANGKISREKEWPFMESKIGKEKMDIIRKNATPLE